MAAPTTPPTGTRERRSALWPYLVMPLIVLVVFYLLTRMHRHPVSAPTIPPEATQPGVSRP